MNTQQQAHKERSNQALARQTQAELERKRKYYATLQKELLRIERQAQREMFR